MNKIDISYENYDKEYYFVRVKRNNESLVLDFELCEFSSEMSYWNIPTKVVEKDGEVGFAISNRISKERIELEIDRFINEYEL